MANSAAAVTPRRTEVRPGLGTVSGAAVIGAALAQGIVGLLTSTVYPQLANPASSSFGPSGALLTAMHLVMLAGVAGLVASGAAGKGRFVVLASGITLVGLVAQALAEAALRIDFAAGNTLFGYAVPLMALGFVLLGVAVMRGGAWHGWHRFTPLLCGLYVPVVLIPAFAIAHGPSFPALAAWQLLFLLLGLAMWSETRFPTKPAGGR